MALSPGARIGGYEVSAQIGAGGMGAVHRARDTRLNRDVALKVLKEIYWAERIGRLGAAEGFRVAEELRRQMLGRDPGWPDAATRQADLRFHVTMAERFRRAGAARGR